MTDIRKRLKYPKHYSGQLGRPQGSGLCDLRTLNRYFHQVSQKLQEPVVNNHATIDP
jgi:hypothetical protein